MRKLPIVRKQSFALILFSGLSLVCCKQKQAEVSPEEARQIAEEAYIFAYPMLENYKTMYLLSIWEDSPAFNAPMNTLFNDTALSGPESTTVVRPNNDTYYTQAVLDLRREPLVISVPAISDKRYYSFQLIDLYTHNFDYIGTRKTGFEAGQYLIAGAGWEGQKPEGIHKVIQTETNLVLALGRTQVYGPDDSELAQRIMAAFHMQPLSSFLGTAEPEAPEPLNFPPYDSEKVESAEFITYLNFFLTTVKPHPSEVELLQRFSRIGIGPGKNFNVENLNSEIREAMEAGIGDAIERIEAAMGTLGEMKNGWMLVAGAFGNREYMQGKYLMRASAAMFGLYGNDLEEAYYPETTLDADNEALDGSKHRYALHFKKEELPPVKAFWSLSMYKLPEQLFIGNEINRYKIGSATEGLKYNDDGSLDIYIQRDNPGAALESNWLPANDGNFSLQARMYWPEEGALEPLYVPPAVKKAD